VNVAKFHLNCKKILGLGTLKRRHGSRIGEWQRELEEFSAIFKKMCKSHKKLSEREDALVTYVANKQLGLFKRVSVYFRK